MEVESPIECNICYEEFKPSNRAMGTPCGHNVCDPCLRKLGPQWVIKGEKVAVPCPFCRKLIYQADCEENLHLQEVANLTIAARLKYPFYHAPCSICKEKTGFADLFVCYCCHPHLMQNVITFEPEKLKKMSMCLPCEAIHRPKHGKKPLTTLPISIYTSQNLSEIEEIAVVLFHKYSTDRLLAPFAVGLIRNAMAPQEHSTVPKSLLDFLIDTSLGFMDFTKEHSKVKENRTAGRLFLKSYWPILKILAGPAFSGMTSVKPMMTALERAAAAAFLVQDEGRDTDLSPFLAQVAVEQYVWEKCSQILETMWRQVVAADKGVVGKPRIDAMMKLLSICRHVFTNTDTVEFLDEIVGVERKEIKEAMCLPHLPPDARQEIANYEENMKEEFEMIELQAADRQIKVDEAPRRMLAGDTS